MDMKDLTSSQIEIYSIIGFIAINIPKGKREIISEKINLLVEKVRQETQQEERDLAIKIVQEFPEKGCGAKDCDRLVKEYKHYWINYVIKKLNSNE